MADSSIVKNAQLLSKNNTIGKVARQMETSDAAKPITEGKIIGVLHEHEVGMKTAGLCRKRGTSNGKFCN